MAGLGVFVFADDGLSYFQTAEEAAGWVEAIDVEAGEYKAFIRLDGERLEPRILDPSTVLLEESGQCDPELLVELLERERVSHRTFTSDSAHRERRQRVAARELGSTLAQAARLAGPTNARRRTRGRQIDLTSHALTPR
jgi:hypothetical protein